MPQSDFGHVYSVQGENMKNLDCPSFPLLCGLVIEEQFGNPDYFPLN